MTDRAERVCDIAREAADIGALGDVGDERDLALPLGGDLQRMDRHRAALQFHRFARPGKLIGPLAIHLDR